MDYIKYDPNLLSHQIQRIHLNKELYRLLDLLKKNPNMDINDLKKETAQVAKNIKILQKYKEILKKAEEAWKENK
jgi:hypothetical protein